jgi:hypothetical protein
VTEAEVELRAGVALVGSEAKPAQSFPVVLGKPTIGECLLSVTKQSSDRKTQMSAQSPKQTSAGGADFYAKGGELTFAAGAKTLGQFPQTGSLSVVKSRMFGSVSSGSVVLSEVRANPAS